MFCYVEASHFTVSFWWQVDPGAWRLLVESGALTVGGLAVGVACFVWRAAGMAARRVEPGWSGRRVLAAGTAALVIAGNLALFPDVLHGALVPELNAVRTFAAFRGLGHPPPTAPLGRSDRRACRGILPAAGPTPDPPPRRPFAATAAVPRHALLVFVESLDAAFLDRPSLAVPAFAAVAAASVRLEGHLDQARPTHFGLVAGLCSLLPGTRPFDTRDDRPLPHHPCLPALARAAGMRTIFVNGGRNTYTGLDRTMRALGFDEVIDRDAIEPPGTAARGLALPDRRVYAYVRGRLDELSAAGRRAFITVITSDSHFPGFPDGGAPRPSASSMSRRTMRGLDRLARGLVSAEAALGGFVGGLAARGRLADTLVVITADHSMPLIPEARELIGGETRLFRELTLLLRGPGLRPGRHRIPSGQLDLAPTVLDLLGLRPPAGAMVGHSLLRPDPSRAPPLFAMSGRRIERLTPPEMPLTTLGALESACRRTGDCGLLRCLNHLDGYWLGLHPL